MAAEADKVEPAESEQDEEEDVYEVERIIDMRVEEGEVLYRVRWKNYCSDDDTWEPEAHLEDCHEVLLAFKRHQAELKSKKEPEPKKISDVFDADSESDSDKDRPAEAPIKKKKKKKKIREEDDDEPLPKEKKKKKKEKRKDDLKPLPAPETDDDEEAAPPSPPKEKKAEAKKRFVDSDEEDEPIVSKKQKKEKPKEGGKHKKDKGEEDKKKKVKKQRKMETSEDEETAPMEEDLSEGPSESQMDDSASAETVTKPAEKSSVEDKVKQKKGKWEVKLQGIIFDKKIKKPEGNQKESSLPKPKSQSSKSKEDSALQSDSSDSSTLIKKPKSKSTDGTPPTQKAPSSSTSSSSSSSSSTVVATNKAKEEEGNKEEALGQKDASGSTNLFEKFLLNCEAKDRAPRRPPAVAEKSSSKPTKVNMIKSYLTLFKGLFLSNTIDFCKGQATLSLGMDLNLDWMTLDNFQKHLNGEDEILSGPPLSPSELRDAVKSGDYMAVKLALNSKEDYNLEQEDVSGMSLCMLAAAGGQDDILRLLIKKGVRVNARQKNGTTALMHAAEKNYLTTVAMLLEAGSYVNAQTLGGETALMKACKRGNADIVRLLLEYGADCNILSKHKNTALFFANFSNNLTVCDLVKDHINKLSNVAEETIRAYFESRLVLLEPVFPLACHRLCEGPDFSMEFGFKAQPQPEGSGILLFIFHANFLNEITARLCGPCSVHAVILNDKFQLPIFLDSHFIYSFSPIPGINKLFIRLAEAPTAKVKLLICAYRVQLQ
uniref:M-phase phosphoprotein 8 n=1 Tax=Cyprinodon variegatus TaxID=28743 RepID=A0A3Q2D7D4_CYPVA